MTSPEIHQRLDLHDERLTAVEGRLDATEGTVERISRDIIAIRAEGQARATAQTEGLDRLGRQIQGLIVQLAEQTGAQKTKNQIAEDSLRRWRKIAVIVGICCTLGAAIGSTLLSDQEIASTIWVKWLHKEEPWSVGVSGSINAPATTNGGTHDGTH